MNTIRRWTARIILSVVVLGCVAIILLAFYALIRAILTTPINQTLNMVIALAIIGAVTFLFVRVVAWAADNTN